MKRGAGGSAQASAKRARLDDDDVDFSVERVKVRRTLSFASSHCAFLFAYF